MDEEELKKEAKLGLRKQEMPKQPTIPKDSASSFDYVHMNPHVMATCLPINTEVFYYKNRFIKFLFREKKQKNTFSSIFLHR